MPTKIDGNNGVLQSYDFQALTTGFSYTFASGTTTLIINPAGTLATGTITMPATPADGMVITIESTQQVTAVTVAANAGQTLVGAASQLIPNQPLSFIYRQSNTTWYPMAGGAGRATAVASGTSVASTSGTSIDFTGIPSWVKRITVMFSGVSTNGTSNWQIQVGTGGTYTTSGYVGAVTNQAGTTAANSAGFLVNVTVAATDTMWGQATILKTGGNSTQVQCTGILANSAAANLRYFGGTVTPANVIDCVRITTVGGTDAFDAGTINILYE